MSHKQSLGTVCAEDFICNAPLSKVTMQLFFPLAFSMIASASIGIVDMYLAGFLGPGAQAAVGLGDQILFLLIVIGTALGTASSSAISRTIGDKDYAACRAFAKSSLIISASLGLLSAVLGILFATPLLTLMACSADMQATALPYIVHNSIANAPFVISLCCSAIFRALGRPMLTVKLWLLTAVLANLSMFVLFFSDNPYSRSLDTLAIGWNFGCFCGALLGVLELRKMFASFPKNTTETNDISQTWFIRTSRELMQLAIPIVLSELSLIIAHFLMYRLLASSTNSAALQAAWTIKIKLEEIFALIPLMALNMSTAVIVGQCIGANKGKRALQASRFISLVASLAMLLVGGFLVLISPAVARSFSADVLTRNYLLEFLAPSVVLFPLMAVSSILCAALEGAGQVRVPMILNVLFLVIARLGFAYTIGIQQSISPPNMGIGFCFAQILMFFGTMSYFYFQFVPKLKASTGGFQCSVI